MAERPPSEKMDRIVGLLARSASLLLVGMFTVVTAAILRHGRSGLSFDFLTSAPENAGRAGGIGPLIVSTVLVLGICLLVSIPLGVGTAAWLSEFSGSRKAVTKSIQLSLDLLASIPSIVFGLFGMVVFCQKLNFGFSILSGGLTLACMVLPIIIRTVYFGFRAVPNEIRHAGTALGMSQTSILRSLLIPATMPAIVVAVLLGIGRSMAETAALIFTSGYVTRMPESVFDSGRVLSVHIYDLAMNVPGGETNAQRTAFVLLASLLVINLCASRFSRRWVSGSKV